MLKRIVRGLHLIYDLAVHGYDTSRNVFVRADGRVRYLDEQFTEEIRQTSEEDLTPFPRESAKAFSALQDSKSKPSKLEFDAFAIKKRT